jgi:plastocyanin
MCHPPHVAAASAADPTTKIRSRPRPVDEPMRRLISFIAPGFIVMVAALVLASCGDDDGADVRESGSGPASESGTASGSESGSASGSASGQPPVSLEGTVSDHGIGEIEGDTLELELDDNYFGPTFVRGTPGQQVTVELVNAGDTTHTFTSDPLGVDEQVDAGAESSVNLTLPDEGAVEFICRFHEGQGMKGAFFFNEGDPVDTGA